MLEKEIVTAIMKYLKSLPYCFCFKSHGGMYGVAGLADIICCYKGWFLALEVKTPKGKPTKLQEATIAKIQRASGIAQIVRSVDEVKKIIEQIY